jgi:UDP-glucose 4-epimerase
MKLECCNALVTGGAGFVGSHLVDALLSCQCSVRALDNLSTGYLENIKHLIGSTSRFNFVEGDVRDFDVCVEQTKDIDVVFHEAAQINPVTAVEKPFYDFEINAKGTLNMLEAAHKNGVKKFIFASTNVYGDPKYLPIDENHPIDLLSPYAAAKLSGEAYCIVYSRTYGLETVRLRNTNIYGPRQRTKSESGATAIFMEKAIRDERFTIFGDGTKTRDFVYISDVVNANMLAAQKDGISGEVFNVGVGKETSINQLAEIVLKTLGKQELSPLYGPPRDADFSRCIADTSKARRILGYEPRVSIEEGVQKTLEWYKKQTLTAN